MSTAILYLLACFAAYLLGAIPFGWLLGRCKGIDIRTCGSGNTGATNVMRSVGTSWGVVTLLLDACKGYLAAAMVPLLLATPPDWLPILCGCAAILGHSFPVYLRFKGGKGVATSAGVLIGIAPYPFLCGILVFALLLAIFRYVSLGSIGAAVTVPLAHALIHGPSYLTAILSLLAVLVLWRHKPNIRRLLQGTENRIGPKKRRAPAATM